LSIPLILFILTLHVLVGFVITFEQVYTIVSEYIKSSVKDVSLGWGNLSSVLSGVRSVPGLRWASTFDVKTAVERIFTETYGVKEVAKPKAKACGAYILPIPI